MKKVTRCFYNDRIAVVPPSTALKLCTLAIIRLHQINKTHLVNRPSASAFHHQHSTVIRMMYHFHWKIQEWHIKPEHNDTKRQFVVQAWRKDRDWRSTGYFAGPCILRMSLVSIINLYMFSWRMSTYDWCMLKHFDNTVTVSIRHCW